MRDIIIVGGGPAGLAAGLYAARAGLDGLLLEGNFAGGQAATTDRLMNYPGFPDGIGGPELMMAFAEQAENAGLTIEYAQADSLALSGSAKRVTAGGKEYEARCLVLAMGAKARPIGARGENELIGRGVSYCATCDGALYRGKDVAVVGGGDTAVEDALYLARASRVTVIHRRDALRARGQLAAKALEEPNISFIWNSVVTDIEKRGENVRLTLDSRGAKRELDVSACFAAVGMTPSTSLARGQLDMDEAGYILAGEDCVTSVPGVFAAGDLRVKPLRQVVCAASDGAAAISSALKYLDS